MRERFAGTLAAAGAVAAASLALVASASAATAATSTLAGSATPAATATPSIGAVPAATRMNFEVNLALGDATGAAAFAKAVSTPGSATYKHYLSPAQWEAKYSPTTATVKQVKAYLRSEGFTVAGVSADRMTIDASGNAAKVEQAFGTTLTYHQVEGHKLIVNDTALSVPSSVAGVISGVSGIPETIAVPDGVVDGATKAGVKATSNAKPPAGFRNAQPCGTYYGQLTASGFPALPGGYPADAPYSPCGYTPTQLRSAYSLTSSDNGAGETVAIIDAYASPTLYTDASEYARLNDPSNPLNASQFSELVAKKFDDGQECEGQSGWYGEQTLDVEAVHATAPGANILFGGAENCVGGLEKTLQTIVDGHLADVVTNSYEELGGDLLEGAGGRAATDDLLQMAAGTGVSVLFSSGDDGDNYDELGQAVPSYPSTSPWATAVGGTTLAIGSSGQRLSEYGWSTGKGVYCNSDLHAVGGCTKAALGTWSPVAYDYGSTGGTSYSYQEPYYQADVVPSSLSELRSSTAMRVVPDISMDADPTTGMLVGETQTFPDGTYYDQYRIGGTSLASPLLAGVIARADETAGAALGFVNPKLYALSGDASAIDDIVSPTSPTDIIRADFLDGVDAADGIEYSARTVDDQGTESFCTVNAKGKEKCTSAPISLSTTPGFDNMTGLGTPGAGFVTALAGH